LGGKQHRQQQQQQQQDEGRHAAALQHAIINVEHKEGPVSISTLLTARNSPMPMTAPRNVRHAASSPFSSVGTGDRAWALSAPGRGIVARSAR
jgi:hypothetical protein